METPPPTGASCVSVRQRAPSIGRIAEKKGGAPRARARSRARARASAGSARGCFGEPAEARWLRRINLSRAPQRRGGSGTITGDARECCVVGRSELSRHRHFVAHRHVSRAPDHICAVVAQGQGSRLIQNSCYAARFSIRLLKGALQRARCICRALPRLGVGRLALVSDSPFRVSPFSGGRGKVGHTSADLPEVGRRLCGTCGFSMAASRSGLASTPRPLSTFTKAVAAPRAATLRQSASLPAAARKTDRADGARLCCKRVECL